MFNLTRLRKFNIIFNLIKKIKFLLIHTMSKEKQNFENNFLPKGIFKFAADIFCKNT
jgi:hypothetical protein